MANIGYVGLGTMGGQMVNRFLEKGHSVTGYNRTRSKAQWLIDKGLKFADSPRAVAASTDFVLSMVTNSEALSRIAEGPNGIIEGLGPGKVWIDMSTASPAVSRALAARVRETGADMVDAPVSGSVLTIQQGKLSVMVGGRPETFERVKPLLLDLGPKVTYVGENGLALVMKIATNLALPVQLSTTSIANEFLTAARAMGLAEQDFAIIFKVLENMSGAGEAQGRQAAALNNVSPTGRNK